jgi:hypothetical protein
VLGPPKVFRSLPAVSYCSTYGAAKQHTLDEGAPPGFGAIPRSFGSSDWLPLCTTHTLFCPSVVTPVTDPITQ